MGPLGDVEGVTFAASRRWAGFGLVLLGVVLAGACRSSEKDKAIDALELGMMAAGEKQYAEAVQHFSAALRIDPLLIQATWERAKAHRFSGSYKAAIEDCGRAIDADPHFPTPYLLRGGARLEIGQVDAALADFDNAIGLAPGWIRARLDGAIARIRIGEFDTGLQYLQTAVNLVPKRARRPHSLAELYELIGAEEAFLSYLQPPRDPQNSTSLDGVERARLMCARGEWEAARICLTRLLDKEPSNWRLHIALGRVDLAAHRVTEAIADIGRAIDASGAESAEAYEVRGNAWAANGNHLRAMADWSKANILDPSRVAALRNRAWHLATSPLSHRRHLRTAIQLSRMAKAQSGSDVWFDLETIAASLAQQGEYERAAELQEAALKGLSTGFLGPWLRHGYLEEVEKRLRLYASEKPFVQT